MNCNRENEDLHLKMCKKIAQLVKVIHSLNVKNDEHEYSLSFLQREKDEIQAILSEKFNVIEEYKLSLSSLQSEAKTDECLENPLQEKITSLETQLLEAEMKRIELIEVHKREIDLLNKTLEGSERRLALENRDYETLETRREAEKENMRREFNEKVLSIKLAFENERESLRRETSEQRGVHESRVAELESEIRRLNENSEKLDLQRTESLKDAELKSERDARETRLKFEEELNRVETTMEMRVLDASQKIKERLVVEEQLKISLADIENEKSKLIQKVENLSNALEELRVATSKKDDHVEACEKEIARLKQLVSKQINDISEKSDSISFLREQLHQQRSQIKELNKTIKVFLKNGNRNKDEKIVANSSTKSTMTRLEIDSEPETTSNDASKNLTNLERVLLKSHERLKKAIDLLQVSKMKVKQLKNSM